MTLKTPNTSVGIFLECTAEKKTFLIIKHSPVGQNPDIMFG